MVDGCVVNVVVVEEIVLLLNPAHILTTVIIIFVQTQEFKPIFTSDQLLLQLIYSACLGSCHHWTQHPLSPLTDF